VSNNTGSPSRMFSKR